MEGHFSSARGAEWPYRRAPQGPLFRVVAAPWAAATRHRKAREGDGPLRDPPRAVRELRAGALNQSKKRPEPAEKGDSRGRTPRQVAKTPMPRESTHHAENRRASAHGLVDCAPSTPGRESAGVPRPRANTSDFDLAREFESCTRCPLKGELTASSMYQRAWNGVSFGSGLTLDRVSL